MNIKDFYRLLAPISRKMMLLIGRGVVKRINNKGKIGLIPGSGTNPQRLQMEGMANETLTDMERWQEYGFESYPKEDSQALVAFINGNRGSANVLCVQDHQYRPTDFEPGDVGLYDADGARLRFNGGKVELGNKTQGVGLVDLFFQLIEILEGDVNLGGAASATKLVTALPDLALLKIELNKIKGSL